MESVNVTSLRKILYIKKSLKDIPKLNASKLDQKAKNLIAIIKENLCFSTSESYGWASR